MYILFFFFAIIVFIVWAYSWRGEYSKPLISDGESEAKVWGILGVIFSIILIYIFLNA